MEGDTMSDTQEVVLGTDQQQLQDLQSKLKELEKENSELRANRPPDPATTSDFFNNTVLQGLCQVISTQLQKGDKDKSKPLEGPELSPVYDEMKPQSKTDNMGPAISGNIAALLEQCWHYPFRHEEIVEALQSQVCPQNVCAVKPLEINEEVHMTKTDRARDRDFKYIGNAICGAGKCLSYLMDMLASAEARLHDEYPEDDGWLVVEGFQFDFPKCNKLIVNAMKLLGMANIQTGQAHRIQLMPKFKPEFKKLCDHNHPFHNVKFFRPSLNSAAALASDQNKVQNQTFQSHGTRSQGRFGNKRFNPYPQSVKLQEPVMQQALQAAALAAAPSQQIHQQVFGLATGGLVGINQYPQNPPPSLLTLSTAFPP